MSTTYFPTKAVVAQTSTGKTTSNSLYIRDNSQWYPIIFSCLPCSACPYIFWEQTDWSFSSDQTTEKNVDTFIK